MRKLIFAIMLFSIIQTSYSHETKPQDKIETDLNDNNVPYLFLVAESAISLLQEIDCCNKARSWLHKTFIKKYEF